MTLRRLAELAVPRRLSVAVLVADGVRALLAGHRRTAFRLLALATLASRSTAAGLAVELGWRLYRRRRDASSTASR